MGFKFFGYIGFNNGSETQQAVRSRVLDKDYVDAAARAQEAGGFDRVLIPFGSNSPESQIVAAHAAAITSRLGFLVAHRPGFTQPTLAARQLATLDQLSGGRVAVHIITGGADEEMARDGDVGTTKAERYARTDEYLTVLRQELSASQPFDHEGRFYRVRQAFSAINPIICRSSSAEPRPRRSTSPGVMPTSTPPGAKRWKPRVRWSSACAPRRPAMAARRASRSRCVR